LAAWFISDLHLTPTREDVVGAFALFMHEVPQPGDALYVLGDLFDAWVGDDDVADPFNARIVERFAACGKRGVAQFLITGNRDFLLGPRFCEAAQMRLLNEPVTIDIHGMRTVMLHGDTLCTGDTAYQAWRTQARSDAWQREFLAKPLDERRAFAVQARAKSEAEKATKPEAIMDAERDAITALFDSSGAARMIHGHTHRPARHDYVLFGRQAKRWVLPAWDEHAGALRVDERGGELIYFD
jgi:UDP-2,3-diacylglucosamine hydrolase